MRPNVFRQFKAIHPGHSAIKLNQAVRFFRLTCAHQFGQGLCATLGSCEQSAPARERLSQNQTVSRIVIHNQSSQSFELEGLQRRLCGYSTSTSELGCEVKGSTSADFAVYPDASSHELHNMFGNS